jgi:hypothetical protein
MKIGDNFYCIKNRNIKGTNTNINSSHKNYKIIYFKNEDIVYLTSELDKDNTTYFYSTIEGTGYYYIYDYFITLKEYRKQKLEKLNEI